MDTGAENISFLVGVEVFDSDEKDPKRLGLKSWFSDKNTTEVRATYGPGNVLVIFDDGTDESDVNDKTILPEKLNRAGILVARLFNVAQRIQTLRDVLKISDYFRKLLAGTAGLPTGSHSPAGDLEDHASAVVDVLDDFRGELEGDGFFLKALEQERDAISKELKSLGVKGISCEGIQVMSSDTCVLMIDL